MLISFESFLAALYNVTVQCTVEQSNHSVKTKWKWNEMLPSCCCLLYIPLPEVGWGGERSEGSGLYIFHYKVSYQVMEDWGTHAWLCRGHAGRTQRIKEHH